MLDFLSLSVHVSFGSSKKIQNGNTWAVVLPILGFKYNKQHKQLLNYQKNFLHMLPALSCNKKVNRGIVKQKKGHWSLQYYATVDGEPL